MGVCREPQRRIEGQDKRGLEEAARSRCQPMNSINEASVSGIRFENWIVEGDGETG